MGNAILHIKWRHLIAINLIAAQAGFTAVLAQNSVENLGVQNPTTTLVQPPTPTPTTAAAQRSAEDAERQRITQLRADADATYDAAKQACYQKFAVNRCIATVREKQRSEITDLKRQEVAMNDAGRKRRGAEQLQRTEAKASANVPEQTASQRSGAVPGAAQPETTQSGKAAVQQNAQSSAQQNAQLRSQNMRQKQADATKSAAERQLTAQAKAAQSKARYEQRIKEADEKRAKALAKQPTKPPAAGLPVPLGAP